MADKFLFIEDYFGAQGLRADTWKELSHVADKLFKINETARDITKLNSIIETCFETLLPIEKFYAFPGCKKVNNLREHYEAKKYDLLSREISTINRAISTDTRKGAITNTTKIKRPRAPTVSLP